MKNKRLPIFLALLAALPGAVFAAGKKKPSPQEASLQASQAVAPQDLPQTLHDQHLKAIGQLLENADNFPAKKEVFLKRLKEITACLANKDSFTKDLEKNNGIVTKQISLKLNELKKNIESKIPDLKIDLLYNSLEEFIDPHTGFLGNKLEDNIIDYNEIKKLLESQGLKLSRITETKLQCLGLEKIKDSEEIKKWEPKNPPVSYTAAKKHIDDMLQHLNATLKKIPAQGQKKRIHREAEKLSHEEISPLQKFTSNPKRQKLSTTMTAPSTDPKPSTVSTKPLENFDTQTISWKEMSHSRILSQQTIDLMDELLDLAKKPTEENIRIMLEHITIFAKKLSNQDEGTMILWEEQEEQEKIFRTIYDKIYDFYFDLKEQSQKKPELYGAFIIDNKTSICEYVEDILCAFNMEYWSCQLSPTSLNDEEKESKEKFEGLMKDYKESIKKFKTFEGDLHKNLKNNLREKLPEHLQNDLPEELRTELPEALENKIPPQLKNKLRNILKEGIEHIKHKMDLFAKNIIEKLTKNYLTPFLENSNPDATTLLPAKKQSQRTQKYQALYISELILYLRCLCAILNENSFATEKDIIEKLIQHQDILWKHLSYKKKPHVDLLPLYPNEESRLYSTHKHPKVYSSKEELGLHRNTLPVLSIIHFIITSPLLIKKHKEKIEKDTYKVFLKNLIKLMGENIEILRSNQDELNYFLEENFLYFNKFLHFSIKKPLRKAIKNIYTYDDNWTYEEEAQDLAQEIHNIMNTYQETFRMPQYEDTSSSDESSSQEEDLQPPKKRPRYNSSQEEEKDPG